jgi:hypothetical protein
MCLSLLSDQQGRGAAVLGHGGHGTGKSALIDSTSRLLGRHCLPVACTSQTLPDALAALLVGCAASGVILRLDDPAALSQQATAVLSHGLSTIYQVWHGG